jgi:O-methyltransferase
MRTPTFPADIHSSMIGHRDYFRHATIGLAVQRVLSSPVPGSFAEVGVYRGEVSQFVHRLAPERLYYLFDTFQGFPPEHLESAAPDQRFADTSVEAVLANVADSRNLVIVKGRVPDTLKGLEDERFAFVLIDLDLSIPTAASLEWFYPRLSRGAYLILHDYNSSESNWGCKRAMDAFMADKVEALIEIADQWGTALFRKV